MHHDVPKSGPCVCTALRKASRAVSRVYDAALEGAGMTTPQFAILRHVAHAGALPLSRLAEKLVMDRTSLYRALEPMQRRGWVAVVPAERGRARIVSLTDAGRTAMDAAAGEWEAVQTRLVAALGPEKWQALEALLHDTVVGAEAMA